MADEVNERPLLVEVFRSLRRRPCDERVLVLLAVGIESVVTNAGARFILWVSEADAARAMAQLRQYESENRPGPPPPRRRVCIPMPGWGCPST